ncbi:hypothetical protein JHK82_037999 [Glycine max]|nr:hypothetical protein JHK82_037999 [Glycine max]
MERLQEFKFWFKDIVYVCMRATLPLLYISFFIYLSSSLYLLRNPVALIILV